VHPDDRERFSFELEQHVSGATPHFENEQRLLHCDGTWRWVLARAVAVRDSKGRATRISGSLTDVTNARSRDPLTGLPNRVLYHDRLERAFARRRRDKGYSFAVLFLDLDRFKVVNDSLGHLAGDQLLVGIARRLERCVRGVDSVARLGGDEFTILLDGVTEANEAIRVAERICSELSKPFELDGRPVHSGTSIGIAMCRDEYVTPEEILRDADTAMYRAKAAGKARYQVFDQGMHDEAMTVLQLENELRVAVMKNELRVVFQPILRLADNAIAGFEALVRWEHPRLGLITPDKFIPLAEETGAVKQVDEWVLAKAAGQLAEWQARYPSARSLYVAVNASKRQVDRVDFVERSLAAIDGARLSRKSIAIEITEGLVFEDPERISKTLLRLRDAGVQVVMDDFGTGYSSLSYLHRLPLTGLKVDRSFVSRLDQPGQGAEAVRAIAALAHGLNLHLTAEGVETEAQQGQLKALGCEQAQGFLFSRPVAADVIEGMLRKMNGVAA
ncbi:MAG: putative bifunctional diguanylate cyclase/phosphodiesterase, partial [Myxococcaceae bacterium]